MPPGSSVDRRPAEHEAASLLGLKVATLPAWRHRGCGPAYVRLGRAVRYLSSDVDEYLRANRHVSSSSAGESRLIVVETPQS